MALFEAKGARVVGVSRDSVESHEKFKAKYALPFTLLADGEGALHDAFGSGKRSTFLIDAGGKVLKVWAAVSVDGHAADVLNAL